MTVEERIRKLERTNRRLVSGLVLGSLVVVAAMAGGAANDSKGPGDFRTDLKLWDDRGDKVLVELSRKEYLQFKNPDGSVKATLTAEAINSFASDIANLKGDLEKLKVFHSDHFEDATHKLIVKKRIVPQDGLEQRGNDGLHIHDNDSDGKLTLQNHGEQSRIRSSGGQVTFIGPITIEDEKSTGKLTLENQGQRSLIRSSAADDPRQVGRISFDSPIGPVVGLLETENKAIPVLNERGDRIGIVKVQPVNR